MISHKNAGNSKQLINVRSVPHVSPHFSVEMGIFSSCTGIHTDWWSVTYAVSNHNDVLQTYDIF